MEKTMFLAISEHETPRFLIEKRGSKTFSKLGRSVCKIIAGMHKFTQIYT
jgi:hypothetical protein